MAKKTKAITVELYAPWPRYRSDLLRIEARCFAHRGDDEVEFERNVREALFLAVIREGDVGFGYCLVERRWPDTAYIAITAIDPDYQDKGHLKTLMSAVEAELVKIGYAYIHRDARVDNGYADKVAKHYGDRVVASYDHASQLGPLRFFRIRLGDK